MSDVPPPPFPPGGAPPPGPGHQPPPPGPASPGYAAPGYGAPPPPQQPGFGQPPFGHQPPPTKKKSRWWIWVLAILLVFAVLIGGCSYLVFRAVTGPIDAANDMLGHLADGEIDEATDLLDFDCFGNAGIAGFETFFTENPVADYDLMTSSNVNGRGEATGTVTLEDGLGPRTAAFSLTNDDGWKVCGIDIDEP